MGAQQSVHAESLKTIRKLNRNSPRWRYHLREFNQAASDGLHQVPPEERSLDVSDKKVLDAVYDILSHQLEAEPKDTQSLDTVLRTTVAIMSSKTVQKALPKAAAAPLLNVLRRYLEGTLTESGVAALAVQSIHAAVERLYESKKGDRIERDIKDMLSKNGASGYLLDVLAKADIGSELAAETLATLVSIVGTHESSTPAVMMEEVCSALLEEKYILPLFQLSRDPNLRVRLEATRLLRFLVLQLSPADAQAVQNLALADGAVLWHMGLACCGRMGDEQDLLLSRASARTADEGEDGEGAATLLHLHPGPKEGAQAASRYLLHVLSANNADVTRALRHCAPSRLPAALDRQPGEEDAAWMASVLGDWSAPAHENKAHKEVLARRTKVAWFAPRGVGHRLNWHAFWVAFDHNSRAPDLLWNEQLRRELVQALTEEAADLDALREWAPRGERGPAWDWRTFKPRLPTLGSEAIVGPFHLDLLVAELSADAPSVQISDVPTLLRSLNDRLAIEANERVVWLCLRAMTLLCSKEPYAAHTTPFQPLPMLLHIIRTSPADRAVVRDEALRLLAIVAAREGDALHFATEGGASVLLPLLLLAERRAKPVAATTEDAAEEARPVSQAVAAPEHKVALPERAMPAWEVAVVVLDTLAAAVEIVPRIGRGLVKSRVLYTLGSVLAHHLGAGWRIVTPVLKLARQLLRAWPAGARDLARAGLLVLPLACVDAPALLSALTETEDFKPTRFEGMPDPEAARAEGVMNDELATCMRDLDAAAQSAGARSALRSALPSTVLAVLREREPRVFVEVFNGNESFYADLMWSGEMRATLVKEAARHAAPLRKNVRASMPHQVLRGRVPYFTFARRGESKGEEEEEEEEGAEGSKGEAQVPTLRVRYPSVSSEPCVGGVYLKPFLSGGRTFAPVPWSRWLSNLAVELDRGVRGARPATDERQEEEEEEKQAGVATEGEGEKEGEEGGEALDVEWCRTLIQCMRVVLKQEGGSLDVSPTVLGVLAVAADRDVVEATNRRLVGDALAVLHAALLPSGSAQANEARCSALIDMDGLVRLASTLERTGQDSFRALLSEGEGEGEKKEEGDDESTSPIGVVRSLLDVVTALADTSRGVAVLAERPRVLRVLLQLASSHARSGAPDLSAVALKGIASLGKDANVASTLLQCGAPVHLLHLAVFHEGAEEAAEGEEGQEGDQPRRDESSDLLREEKGSVPASDAHLAVVKNATEALRALCVAWTESRVTRAVDVLRQLLTPGLFLLLERDDFLTTARAPSCVVRPAVMWRASFRARLRETLDGELQRLDGGDGEWDPASVLANDGYRFQYRQELMGEVILQDMFVGPFVAAASRAAAESGKRPKRDFLPRHVRLAPAVDAARVEQLFAPRTDVEATEWAIGALSTAQGFMRRASDPDTHPDARDAALHSATTALRAARTVAAATEQWTKAVAESPAAKGVVSALASLPHLWPQLLPAVSEGGDARAEAKRKRLQRQSTFRPPTEINGHELETILTREQAARTRSTTREPVGQQLSATARVAVDAWLELMLLLAPAPSTAHALCENARTLSKLVAAEGMLPDAAAKRVVALVRAVAEAAAVEEAARQALDSGMVTLLLDWIVSATRDRSQEHREVAASALGALLVQEKQTVAAGSANPDEMTVLEYVLAWFEPLFDNAKAKEREALMNAAASPSPFLEVLDDTVELPTLVWTDELRDEMRAYMRHETGRVRGELLAWEPRSAQFSYLPLAASLATRYAAERPALARELVVDGIFVRQYLHAPLQASVEPEEFLGSLFESLDIVRKEKEEAEKAVAEAEAEAAADAREAADVAENRLELLLQAIDKLLDTHTELKGAEACAKNLGGLVRVITAACAGGGGGGGGGDLACSILVQLVKSKPITAALEKDVVDAETGTYRNAPLVWMLLRACVAPQAPETTASKGLKALGEACQRSGALATAVVTRGGLLLLADATLGPVGQPLPRAVRVEAATCLFNLCAAETTGKEATDFMYRLVSPRIASALRKGGAAVLDQVEGEHEYEPGQNAEEGLRAKRSWNRGALERASALLHEQVIHTANKELPPVGVKPPRSLTHEVWPDPEKEEEEEEEEKDEDEHAGKEAGAAEGDEAAEPAAAEAGATA